MPDFQGQFVPDGKTMICKGALTIGLGLTVRMLRMRMSDEERRHLKVYSPVLSGIRIVALFLIKTCNTMKKFSARFCS